MHLNAIIQRGSQKEHKCREVWYGSMLQNFQSHFQKKTTKIASNKLSEITVNEMAFKS